MNYEFSTNQNNAYSVLMALASLFWFNLKCMHMKYDNKGTKYIRTLWLSTYEVYLSVIDIC